MAPATRGRSSTRPTASNRPEKSLQMAVSCCSTTATDTGTRGAGAGALVPGEALVLCSGHTTTAAPAASMATPATPALQSQRREVGWEIPGASIADGLYS